MLSFGGSRIPYDSPLTTLIHTPPHQLAREGCVDLLHTEVTAMTAVRTNTQCSGPVAEEAGNRTGIILGIVNRHEILPRPVVLPRNIGENEHGTPQRTL